MAKIYAVRQGVVPGIYTTWADCEKQVKGYKGAEYKSFKDPKEAERYVFGEPEIIQEAINKTIKLNAEETSEFLYLLNAIRDADNLEDVRDYVDNINDLIE